MRVTLSWKLLALNAAVVILVLVAVWVSIELHAANYFMTLMKEFDLDAPEINDMFLWANRKTLIQVAIVSGIIVAVLCFWMRWRKLTQML